MNVTFCVTGLGIFGTRDGNIRRHRTRTAPGWMLAMLNVSGRSPFLAAFLQLVVGDVRLGPADAAFDQVALVGERNVGVGEGVQHACQLVRGRNVGGGSRRRRRVLRKRRADRGQPHLDAPQRPSDDAIDVTPAAAAPIAAAAATLVAMAFTVIFMVRSPPRLAPRCSQVAIAGCDRCFVRQCRDVTQKACAMRLSNLCRSCVAAQFAAGLG